MIVDTTMVCADLTTVIIPCFNDLERTRLSVDALLLRHARRPWELIVVDQGSTDGTADFLAGLRRTAPVRVEVITDVAGRGLAGAYGRGLHAARGDYLALIRCGAVVTDGWLDQLVALVESDPRIGLAAPMSNDARPPQLVPDAPYGDLDDMHRFAARWRAERRGRWLAAEVLSGPCVLMRRAAWEAARGPGGRPEMAPSLAELCLRARRAGHVLAVAQDLFVHHSGGRGSAGGGAVAATASHSDSGAAEVTRIVGAAASGREMAKIFGIGLMKSGTSSLSRALNLLGIRSLHSGAIHEVDRRDAATDSPAAIRFRELDVMYPGSKFILTVRDPAAWLASWEAHCRRGAALAFEFRYARARLFGRLDFDAEAALRAYRRHEAEVRAHFARRPGDLLVMDITAGDGWAVLCPFLGVPIPEAPFPWVNRRPDGGPASGRDEEATGTRPGAVDAAPGVAAVPRRARVSLTMIVRDERRNLPACLGSVAGLFDETVVVDTGSTDRSTEVARSFGARVFDFVWVDDFAAARNAALARAAGDYAFWLDADDVLDGPEREKLAALLAGLRAGDEAAYAVGCLCDPGPGGCGGTVVDQVRLFPVREDIRWSGRISEQIRPALCRAGVPVRPTDITIRRIGAHDPARRLRELDRDEALFREELAERPDDPFVLFTLGAIAVGRWGRPAALEFLRRSLCGAASEDAIAGVLHTLTAMAPRESTDLEPAAVPVASGRPGTDGRVTPPPTAAAGGGPAP